MKDDSYYWETLKQVSELKQGEGDKVAYLIGLHADKLNAEQIENILRIFKRNNWVKTIHKS